MLCEEREVSVTDTVSIRTSVASSWVVFPGESHLGISWKFSKWGPSFCHCQPKLLFFWQFSWQDYCLASVTANTEDLWEPQIICIQVMRLSFFRTWCLHCMLTRGKCLMVAIKLCCCCCCCFFSFFPSPKACIIDDSSCQGTFLSTKFILTAFFAY